MMGAAELKGYVAQANQTVTEGQAAAQATKNGLDDVIGAMQNAANDANGMLTLTHEKMDEAAGQYSAITENDLIVQAASISRTAADRANEIVHSLEEASRQFSEAIAGAREQLDEIVRYGTQAIEQADTYAGML